MLSLATRLLIVALVIGTAAAVAATGHITVPLLAATTMSWGLLAVALQLAVAFAVVGIPASRTVGLWRGLDLFFAEHCAWSAWLLAFAAWALLTPPIGRPARYAEVTAIVPLVWTARRIQLFCRRTLGCAGRAALWRTLAHQALTWSVAAVLLRESIWPRAVGLWLRWFAS